MNIYIYIKYNFMNELFMPNRMILEKKSEKTANVQ